MAKVVRPSGKDRDDFMNVREITENIERQHL
jgi:hypothetical protein